MSCDHELANEWARCSGKNASYITILVVSFICSVSDFGTPNLKRSCKEIKRLTKSSGLNRAFNTVLPSFTSCAEIAKGTEIGESMRQMNTVTEEAMPVANSADDSAAAVAVFRYLGIIH